MSRKYTLTVDIHNPKVHDIRTLDGMDTVVVGLSNDGAMHGSVDMFFDGVDALRDFIGALQAKVSVLEEYAS